MFDWSAVYARVIGGMSLASAPMAFAVFALCMASGRFLGDFIVAKMGTLKVLRLSGLLMSVGIGISILARPWPLILTGFALVGLGTANVVPILFGLPDGSKDIAPEPALLPLPRWAISVFSRVRRLSASSLPGSACPRLSHWRSAPAL
jgi:MFS family permease